MTCEGSRPCALSSKKACAILSRLGVGGSKGHVHTVTAAALSVKASGRAIASSVWHVAAVAGANVGDV